MKTKRQTGVSPQERRIRKKQLKMMRWQIIITNIGAAAVALITGVTTQGMLVSYLLHSAVITMAIIIIEARKEGYKPLWLWLVPMIILGVIMIGYGWIIAGFYGKIPIVSIMPTLAVILVGTVFRIRNYQEQKKSIDGTKFGMNLIKLHFFVIFGSLIPIAWVAIPLLAYMGIRFDLGVEERIEKEKQDEEKEERKIKKRESSKKGKKNPKKT